MTLSNNLTILRKRKGYSQEELAYQLGVSRQSVSKWELGQSEPELDRIIKIADFFEVTVDELVRDEEVTYIGEKSINHQTLKAAIREAYHYEYKSQWHIGGVPLVHINVGRGRYVAKGVIAFGNVAIGVFSLGGLAIGLLSIGGLAIGGLSLAGLALGILAIGGASIGYIALGGFALGIYACGGLAIASKLAMGGVAHGYVAIGSSVKGSHTLVVHQVSMGVDGQAILAFVQQHITLPQFIIDLFTIFI